MFIIEGTLSNGCIVYMTQGGCWVDKSNQLMGKFDEAEAHRRLRINNANNRFLDSDDRIEARVVESR